ncbi:MULTISPECIES: hypothetical protein [Legionella]|uniref:Uncharacterized protein n=1 Tax=Legionella resiliens TaxID=2905958 RepID=A0ABS8X2U3_9GAMM|nr:MULTISPECIES: hypothetical protein [unclassified Legionella]MCE0723141.1 hypothetical protein [Legionella sp. 9fVS26]MCE3532294.1 hypothetical protein [Legionella sp. 8cVS16]QLZ68423.1 hypothetical protein FOLKNPGA_01201 [Legionella sp. PC1000]
MHNFKPYIAAFNTIKKDDKMMSRLGMFFKPVLETTAYSIGAATVGSSIYHAGTYINKKAKKQEQGQEQSKNDINVSLENDSELHASGPGMKIGF